MKKMVLLAGLSLVLFVSPAPAAPPNALGNLRTELTALTEAISAQVRLVRIYDEMGKTKEAVATRREILVLVDRQKKVLDQIAAACGRKVAAPTRSPFKPGGRVHPPVIRPHVQPGLVLGPPTTLKEVVKRGLDWLARAQSQGGYWDCDGFGKEIGGPVSSHVGQGAALYDPGVTSLALLAYLGNGETDRAGHHENTVRNGMKYLKQIQDPEGCFGPRTSSHFIYATGIATLAMCEIYAATSSPIFKQSAQRGADFILKCQNPYLAWRYGVRPGDNDTSVTGWMVAALASARAAGLRVDKAGFEGALAWLDKVTDPEYGRVGYTTRGSSPARPQGRQDEFPADKSESLTAEGIVIRMDCGQDPRKSELIEKGVELCSKQLPRWSTRAGTIDMYYWFWGSMAMSRVGGRVEQIWRTPMRPILLAHQRRDGVLAGSFDPVGVWGRDGGRIYSTALLTMVAEIVDHSGHVFGVR